ncbi:hypothetical protein [Rhizobium sp. 18055]|uniref:hypothetical protein n=1 Tax=Rhizobium sp. 18055 TaxID=2681403 RepID=UPI001359778E|nr:hypothetical protein [Rhizobium sp. 18055]
MDGLICQGLAQAAHALNAVFGGITTLSPGGPCGSLAARRILLKLSVNFKEEQYRHTGALPCPSSAAAIS